MEDADAGKFEGGESTERGRTYHWELSGNPCARSLKPLTTYSLREKNRQQRSVWMLWRHGQEVQNGAISDLGMVTSTIAEQIGGSV